MSSEWTPFGVDQFGFMSRFRRLSDARQEELRSMLGIPELVAFEKDIQGSSSAWIECEPMYNSKGMKLASSGTTVSRAYKNLVNAIASWQASGTV